jgi:hypothetical protein
MEVANCVTRTGGRTERGGRSNQAVPTVAGVVCVAAGKPTATASDPSVDDTWGVARHAYGRKQLNPSTGECKLKFFHSQWCVLPEQLR